MVYFKDEIKENNKIDILPMIDIIFAILSFLIISSLYLSRVDTMSVDLPKATTSIRQNNKFINLTIDKNGIIYLDREKVFLEDIIIKVQGLIRQSKNLVVIHADKNVSHGNVINVLDLLRGIDDLKIAISTKSLK
tara:strand:+ start:184 stop:588 length:405 start_codon:yes stop_codon:yes gene_type:complete